MILLDAVWKARALRQRRELRARTVRARERKPAVARGRDLRASRRARRRATLKARFALLGSAVRARRQSKDQAVAEFTRFRAQRALVVLWPGSPRSARIVGASQPAALADSRPRRTPRSTPRYVRRRVLNRLGLARDAERELSTAKNRHFLGNNAARSSEALCEA